MKELTQQGIDVSHWQGTINYKAYKKNGGEFVIIKHSGANIGRLYVSDSIEQHLQPARDAGLKIGFYYVVNGYMNIKQQAKFFVDNVSKIIQKNDIVVLDNESLDKGRAFTPDEALEWLEYVETKLHITPFYYSYPALIKASDHTTIANRYPLWLAAFNKNNGTTEGGWEKHMAYWKQPTIWQYTSNGTITGYSSRIDKNLAVENIFQQYGYGEEQEITIPETEEPKLPLLVVDGIAGRKTWTRIQTYLKKEWGYTGRIDGITGRLTYSALQRWANSLNV